MVVRKPSGRCVSILSRSDSNLTFSDTVCTLLYQSIPVLITSSAADSTIRSWLFPAPAHDEDDSYFNDGADDDDTSGVEVKSEKIDEKSEEKKGADKEGDTAMPEAKTSSDTQVTVVKTHVSFPNTISCTNMISANGRLVSCGKTSDSFVHWNFVCSIVPPFA